MPVESARAQFEEFEADTDQKLCALGLWQLPLRTAVSSLFLIVDSLFTGGRFTRENEVKPKEGAALLSYISYLVRFFTTCPLEIGSDIDDALGVIEEKHQEELRTAIVYGHFSQLMPEVWRQYYEIDVVRNGFRLSHPSQEFTRAEERDIISSEFTLAFDVDRRNYPREILDRAIQAWPYLDGLEFSKMLADGVNHYLTTMREQALLPDDAYEDAVGFGRDHFHLVRAALMAIADFCLGMADAAEIRSMDEPERFARECREWAVPLLTESFMLGTIQGLTEVPAKIIDKIIAPFVMDATERDFQNAGDGYLPPLIRISESFLFSPYAIKFMMPERNILYVLNKRDRTRFDRSVSSHLEPELLRQACEILGRIPGLLIERNVLWTEGEIDILAFQPVSNTILHLQAKAAVPPQGARMTRQVETSTLTAIQQLSALEQRPAEYRDQLCARTFRREIEDPKWVSVVLSRSSFGTWRAWSGLGSYTPLNIPLLRATVEAILTEPNQSIAGLSDVARELLDKIVVGTVRGWIRKPLVLLGTSIDTPLLDIDQEAVWKLQHELWR